MPHGTMTSAACALYACLRQELRDAASRGEAGYSWLKMSFFLLKSQEKSSLRLSKSSAPEIKLDSKRAVLCLVVLITNGKRQRDLKCAGIHSRNLEDFFKMPKDVHLV